MKHVYRRILAATASLSVIGVAAVLAAPVQVNYIQVMGWDNVRAEKQVNARLHGIAEVFTKETKAIPAAGGMEGFGVLSMQSLSDVNGYLTVGVETYRIRPQQANGESHFHAYVFDKAQGQEVSAAAVLGYRPELGVKLLPIVEKKLRAAEVNGNTFDYGKLRQLLTDKNYIPDFYFTNDGIPVMYFEAGVIAPRVVGTIMIPFEDVSEIR